MTGTLRLVGADLSTAALAATGLGVAGTACLAATEINGVGLGTGADWVTLGVTRGGRTDDALAGVGALTGGRAVTLLLLLGATEWLGRFDAARRVASRSLVSVSSIDAKEGPLCGAVGCGSGVGCVSELKSGWKPTDVPITAPD